MMILIIKKMTMMMMTMITIVMMMMIILMMMMSILKMRMMMIFCFQLITDSAKILTESDEVRSWLLQGVEKCRRMYPNFSKKTLNQ